MNRIYILLLIITLFILPGTSGCSAKQRSFQELKKVFQTNSIHYLALEMIDKNEVPIRLKVDYLTNFNIYLDLRSKNRDINQKIFSLLDENNNPNKQKILDKLSRENNETAVSIFKYDNVLEKIAREILWRSFTNQ